MYHILGRVAKLQADALQKHYRPPIARVRHILKLLLANICGLLLVLVIRKSVFIFFQGAPGEPGLPGDRGNPVGHMQYHNPRGWFIFLFMKTPDLSTIYDSPE